MRTTIQIVVATAMAVAAICTAHVITRPPQKPIQSSLPRASSVDTKAMRSTNLIAAQLNHDR
jgi:hypothetical protein